MLTTLSADFDEAVAAFRTAPGYGTLVGLDRAAVPLLLLAEATGTPERWKPITDPDAFEPQFYEIRVACDGRLTDAETERLSGCLGYALAETVRGESLDPPTVHRPADGAVEMTVLEFYWDSTKSQRTSPDFPRAFEVAAVYIESGTPVRTTDRQGPGTKGTRLVEGIGRGRCNISFYVR